MTSLEYFFANKEEITLTLSCHSKCHEKEFLLKKVLVTALYIFLFFTILFYSNDLGFAFVDISGGCGFQNVFYFFYEYWLVIQFMFY